METHDAGLNGGIGADRKCGPFGVHAGPIGMAGCEPPPSRLSGGVSHKAEMMAFDEKRGPVFTMTRTASRLDGVMLHRRPFGPGV